MRNRNLLMLLLCLALLYPASGRAVQAQSAIPTTLRVVTPAQGGLPDQLSVNPVLSSDGNVVVFASRARNLLPNETFDSRFEFWQIYAYDRAQQRMERISLTPGDQPGNASSGASPPAVSADGRFVAYASRASNLVFGDTNDASDIFVRDRHMQQTTRVSVSSAGAQGNRDTYLPAISADGRFVAFISQATNLVAGDTNNAADVFVHDRQTGQTARVSVASGGGQANAASGLSAPAISADGRYVAFASSADNLVAGDTNNAADVFVHDRQTGQTIRVSVASSGAQANAASTSPAISGDGRYVAFLSTATNLAPGATQGHAHVYLHDRQTGGTTLLSIGHDGAPANRASFAPVISQDGRFVAFASAADNLVPGDTNQAIDVFLHDGLSGEIERVSLTAAGNQAQGIAWRPALADFGRYVAFESPATNLTAAPGPGFSDIYLRDRGPQASGAFTLAGRFANYMNEPVAGLTVTVGRRFPRQTVSGADGRFAVANLPAGDYVVDVDAAGYLLQPAFPRVVTVDAASAPSDDNPDGLLVRVYPCTAPSGLNLCELQPGDIFLALTPHAPDWPLVGGVYFTQASLYVGLDESGPLVVQATGASLDEAEIAVQPLVETRLWRDEGLLDWAVIRPPVNTMTAQRAVDAARALAADPDIGYGFFDADGETPLSLDDATHYYDAKLIVQAYAQAGRELVPPDADHAIPTPAALAGWATPDQLYAHNPQVQRRAVGAQEQPFLVWAEGPVRLALAGDNGVRMGYRPAGAATLAPLPYLYSGEGAGVESLAVSRLDTSVAWTVELTGVGAGNFVLVWRDLSPNGQIAVSGGSVRGGETHTWPLDDLGPREHRLYIPHLAGLR